jgi:hypothetical protein
MAKITIAQRLLGETATVPAPEAVEKDMATDDQALKQGQSPSVEMLAATWEQGQKAAVAVRVLDALDSYQQFVQLLFRIGEENALELGGIMDEMTSEEKSPHEYDVVPTSELGAKYGKGPKPGPSTHAAVGESTASKIIGA